MFIPNLSRNPKKNTSLIKIVPIIISDEAEKIENQDREDDGILMIEWMNMYFN